MVSSWDVAQDIRSLDLRDLMRQERKELVSVLSDLSLDDWRARAVGSWDVQAVTQHLFGNDCGRLREGWNGERFGSVGIDYTELAELIERENDEWVEASRLVPTVLVSELLLLSGRQLDQSLADVDMEEPGVPVAWSGSGPSPAWLDIAREYTERWVHQQQIRDAVGREGLKGKKWMGPVFETFMLSLPRAYDDVVAPIDTIVRVVVVGPSGGTWYLRRDEGRWGLVEPAASASAEVRFPEDVAWRLLVRLIPVEEAMLDIERSGSSELSEPACRAVAVMTSAL